MKRPSKNVFVVASPLQLLNAIEAKHHFQLTNNHLIVYFDGAYSPERIKELILHRDWDGIHFLEFSTYPFSRIEAKLLGSRFSERADPYIGYFHSHINRMKINNLVKALGNVNYLFLGDYMTSLYTVKHMFHIANTLRHERLFLLDDGTSTIVINEDRKNRLTNVDCGPAMPNSHFGRLSKLIRDRFVEWDQKEAPSVTFFSAYDINVRDGDFLIKNEYKHLRAQTKKAVQSDSVFFVGQLMVETEYISEESYLECIAKVKDYFAPDKLVYIPHPRASASRVRKIEESLGLTIMRTNIPIECEICIRGNRPKVLASFLSSALQNCKLMLDDLSIKAFHIPPDHWLRESEYMQSIYKSLESNTSNLFTIVYL
jgi:hypothetical protein